MGVESKHVTVTQGRPGGRQRRPAADCQRVLACSGHQLAAWQLGSGAQSCCTHASALAEEASRVATPPRNTLRAITTASEPPDNV